MKKLLRWIGILLVAMTLFGCAYAQHMDKGDKLYEEGKYEQALAEYEAALEVDPGSKAATEKVRLTREKLVSSFQKDAEAALASRDFMAAIIAAGRGHLQFPESEAIRALVRDVSESVQRESQARLDANDYSGAIQLLEAIYETLPSERVVVEPRIEEAKAAWSQQVIQAAQSAEQEGRKGEALLMYAKAAELTENEAYASKRDQYYAQVMLQNTYVVAPSGRGERYESIMQSVPRRAQYTTLAVLGPEEEADTIHASMEIRASRPDFDTRKRSYTKTAQYQSGTKQVPNPFYKSKQDELAREERKLTSAENDVTRLQSDLERYRADVQREGDTPNRTTGAEQNVYNAENRLEAARRKVVDQRNRVQRKREEVSKTPQFKDEPVYADHPFEVTEHQLVATLDLDVRVKHQDGRPDITVEKRVVASATDIEHAAQPVANVPGDPLELPERQELEEELYKQAAQVIEQTVGRSFQGWRESLLARARAAATEGERIDLYVEYVLTNPSEVEPTVVEEISRMRGVPDVTTVLAR